LENFYPFFPSIGSRSAYLSNGCRSFLSLLHFSGTVTRRTEAESVSGRNESLYAVLMHRISAPSSNLFTHYPGSLMRNNDILRRLRYTFDLKNSQMIALFALAGVSVSGEQVGGWLKRDEDPAYQECSDRQLAVFLNGLIVDKRGKKDGPQPEPETVLTNNSILMKLRIALNLKAEDVQEIISLADMPISKHELSAFFRRPGHKHYRDCKDQMLRNFLKGVQIKYCPAR
jgi:uncharacterized protein YehS (DUF1456 family)